MNDILENINFPVDIKKINHDQLPEICYLLRRYLLESVAQSGGHLSAGLGMVELTIALHRVYDAPHDKIIWDVGHQAYLHKILTGRKNQMHTIRKKNGLSGFPKREESQYDAFGVGHSSTSISAALGMAVSANQQGIKQNSIAVIGDGAMTAGMVYEALNHAGSIDPNILVILNDNDMSISPNVGGLHKYLTRLLTSPLYTRLRERSKKILSHSKLISQFTKKSEEHMKGMVMPSTIFEEMGFLYYGPVDGHDIHELILILENLKNYPGPRLLHIVTKKGKGYAPAERYPTLYHGVSAFDLDKGIIQEPPTMPLSPTYTEVFGQWLCDMAEQDKRLIAITPAMREGSGLVEFSKRFPERYHDVAIAEQHAVTFAAGLACQGSKPVVAIYSSFLQRAYDQLIHDVALQNLPVIFAIDRAGLVGNDGPTHSGNYDLSFLRCIPNMIIMVPSHEDECRQMLYTAYQCDTPTAIRYPRGKGVGILPQSKMIAIPIGKGIILQTGNTIAILLFGSLLEVATQVADTLNCTLVNMRFVKPLDTELIETIAHQHDLLITLEDNAISGGAGSAINEYLMSKAITKPVLNLGIPDRYIEHASQQEQLEMIGLSSSQIITQINQYDNGRFSKCALYSASHTSP